MLPQFLLILLVVSTAYAGSADFQWHEVDNGGGISFQSFDEAQLVGEPADKPTVGRLFTGQFSFAVIVRKVMIKRGDYLFAKNPIVDIEIDEGERKGRRVIVVSPHYGFVSLVLVVKGQKVPANTPIMQMLIDPLDGKNETKASEDRPHTANAEAKRPLIA